MKTYLFLVPILFILSSTSQATQITVKKVKGRQAIVETGLPLDDVQTY